jgi:hypothetical protein
MGVNNKTVKGRSLYAVECLEGAFSETELPVIRVLGNSPATRRLLWDASLRASESLQDFGENWITADAGLKHRYVWGLVVDQDDPTLLYVSAASGAGRAHGSSFSDAAIYRRRGAGQWQPVLEHLAEFPYALVADPEASGSLYAGFGDGRVVHSSDAGANWNEVAQVPGLDTFVAVIS